MNINEVKQILTKYDVSVKKQFGQNFLMDDNIVNKICDVSDISKEVNVIEIGPGLGFLTQKLKERANKVMCYEIDPEMALNDVKEFVEKMEQIGIVNIIKGDNNEK